ILGACNSLQFTGMNTITLADLRPNQVSSGTSLMAVNQQLALSFGIAIGALLLQSFSHSNFINHNITSAFRITFIILGIFTMLSSWIFARLHAMDGENLLTRKK
ncbi:MAG: MFS transporter, partial [Snodgrassella sp.]|nr:MFS transporter [Snodgrassella sp.]